jgi:hypothetical protein
MGSGRQVRPAKSAPPSSGWGFVEIPGVSPVSRNPWYVTASHFVRGGSGVMPEGPIHAKRMGMTAIACGVSAVSWHK